MSQESYGYSNRDGIWSISWHDFHGICQEIALAAANFNPEIIIAVGRGGFYPGTLIAHLLRTEIYPVRFTRRKNDVVLHEKPQWLLEPPALVRGKRILVVDEIASSGQTLLGVKQKVEEMGASVVQTAVLYAHTWGANIPDYIGLISDALLLNPWDREVVVDGCLQFHPEYIEALAKQNLTPDKSLRIPASPINLAKSPI
ncbi:phosphoribosyltransferase [Candidatus Leptofilum sp.]|uniref:phosphoribosyltransferase n=1 Tax=Candidatus Leptofilum sp. TaxID=3241576 RepID=UPI003B59401B